ncbi:hypothetical protein AU156_gp115 [Edwardsiella phage PEi20]|uniref:Uncharacterized protein n=2 Tax=Kanagawavirus pei20 TaxID=2844109 RepID=A0A0B6VLI5_9CAUD|nr:hypothetical protein AU156_gp115 [Edwardsiella phage PEi20]BAQ22765.1 conserved hypothetical protein [Edwardsiella phage PEi20]BAQ23067.1 conserved hypothetical protein [Edwardsiella phage PEi26]
MITKEQKEHIFWLADEMRIAQAAATWSESNWSASRASKEEDEQEVDNLREQLEQYLESIMA